MLALIGIAVAGLSWWQAQRLADTDVQAATILLAGRVLAAEKAQRAQLLGRKGKDAVIDVGFSTDPTGSSAPAPPTGTLAEVADYFRSLPAPRRLAITGVAGAGKTVLAIELILELLHNRPPDDPVPVRISAASLDADVPTAKMLSRHLITTYGLKPVTAQLLVAAERILPVVDGLDEMDESDEPGYGSRAARVLRALEDYEHGLNRCSLVMTCRSVQYDALVADRATPHGVARVNLDEVTGDKAWQFIQAITDQEDPDRWLPVLDALTSGGHVLAAALNTPWRLTLAASVYEERDPHTGRYVRSPAALTEFADESSVREHLFSLFIPARLAAADPAGKGPTAEQTHAWLAVLAGYLRTNASRPPFHGRMLSSTDLVPHQLWPLAGDRPRFIGALVILALALPMVALYAGVVVLTFSQMKILNGRIPARDVAAFLLLWLPGVATLGVLTDAVNARKKVWPKADVVSSGRVRNTRDRMSTAVSGVLLVAAGTLLAVVLIPEFGGELPPWAPVVFGLLLGIGMTHERSKHFRSRRDDTDPKAVIRNEVISILMVALTHGPAFGLMLGAMFSLQLEGLSLTAGLTAGALYGSALGASMSLRLSHHYLGLLLSTRGRLPWRLGRFLDRCYGAGLLRISGTAYQFRHRDLQDYVAAHPVPSLHERSPALP
ncbi:NACHT domain-containing protein [Nonomuraea longispora]|uniref:NACHT domain-containing protein n=1 Tax=Nonomuraea longispora TaxID=1848320 RepID=A0A4R4NMH2_9ACTN|nr:NACHT domain-containing protein [Nonomuraea longispora]TDC08847.1 NACHT domain-containing protein [Nonomuraea longispora]